MTSAPLDDASVENFTVAVDGSVEFTLPVVEAGGWPITGVWPHKTPMPFGAVLEGVGSGATRLKHVTPRSEEMPAGSAFSCAGRFEPNDGSSQPFDVNLSTVPSGQGMSVALVTTDWTCASDTFGDGDDCQCNCGTVDPDCAPGICSQQCSNDVEDADETDVDCGGANCSACSPGQGCASDTDCESGLCSGGACLPPAVLATLPADGSVNQSIATKVAVTFSAPMTPATLTAQTTPGGCTGSIQLSNDGFATCLGFSADPPTMLANDTQVELTPSPLLAWGTTHKLRVTTAAQDAFGNALGATYTSTTGFMTPSLTCDSAIRISQIYGGGGNSSASYTHDFVELYNTGTDTVNLSGWSVQYANAAGSTWNVTLLNSTIPGGGHFLVRLASSGANGAALPTPDASGTTNMSSSAGKVALTASSTPLPVACPSPATYVDLVGYGATASCFEGGAPTGAPSNTTSVQRNSGGCMDTNQNGTDFTVGAVNPRNSDSPTLACCEAI